MSTVHGEAWARALRESHAPHRLHKDVHGDLWETISYPWAEGDKVLVNVRVPGDPTSMRTVAAVTMVPEGRACLCAEAERVLGRSEFYMTPEYYARREKGGK